MAKMILESVRREEVLEGGLYLLVKAGKEVLAAVWNGKGWVQEQGPDLPGDWPDVVFVSPTRGSCRTA